MIELNSRIITFNKKKFYDENGELVKPKYNIAIAPTWFLQAGVAHRSKKDVKADRVQPTRDHNGLVPLAKGHELACGGSRSQGTNFICVTSNCINYFK